MSAGWIFLFVPVLAAAGHVFRQNRALVSRIQIFGWAKRADPAYY